jgi:hypothetical protein
MLAMTLTDVMPPESRAALVAAFHGAREQEHHAAAWQHCVRSGQIIDVEMVSRQMRWGGRPTRLAAVMDVTSQRKASVELKGQRRDPGDADGAEHLVKQADREMYLRKSASRAGV